MTGQRRNHLSDNSDMRDQLKVIFKRDEDPYGDYPVFRTWRFRLSSSLQEFILASREKPKIFRQGILSIELEMELFLESDAHTISTLDKQFLLKATRYSASKILVMMHAKDNPKLRSVFCVIRFTKSKTNQTKPKTNDN